MAEMGSRDLKSHPLIVGAEGAARSTLVVAGAIVPAVACAPANPISVGPIMGEGFTTYSDFNPALNHDLR
jgi:hypothetical protein